MRLRTKKSGNVDTTHDSVSAEEKGLIEVKYIDSYIGESQLY